MWQGPTRSSSPDLYCHESVAYFDDEDLPVKNVSQTSTSSEVDLDQSTCIASNLSPDMENNSNDSFTKHSKNTQGDHPTSRRRIDFESFENCISILDDDDYMKLLQSDNIIDKPVKSNQDVNVKGDKFTSGLLSEFTKSSNTSTGKREHHRNREDDLKITTWINSLDSRQPNSWSQTTSRCADCEQKVPEITLTMNDVSNMEEDNMNVLIIKDEAMCESDSGSELEWNSLTPPVPASPSDQRVPEADFEFDLCGGDCGSFPVHSSSTESFLSSPFSAVEIPNHHWYFQPQIALRTIEDDSHTETDQVVPVL